MIHFSLILSLILVGSISFSKPLTTQQMECVTELNSYKGKRNKPVLSSKETLKYCGSRSTLKFLSCLRLAERPVGSVTQSAEFCAKEKNHEKLACLQDLAVYKDKNGEQELKGKKLIAACNAKKLDKFLGCVAKTQRSLGGAKPASDLCKTQPKQEFQACVSELGSYSSENGKNIMKSKDVLKTCKKDSSDRFLACEASTQRSLDGLKVSIKSCGKYSKRLPASKRHK